MITDMDSALLRTFSAVATLGSFSAAAQRLNMTQSTVSQQIARLEEHLGKQLFVRTTRHCRLTHAGDELMDRASKVVALVDEMESAFRPELSSGTVVVGVVDDSYLFAPLTRALAEFVERRPTVSIEIRAGMSADLLRELKARNIELALLRVDPEVERAGLLQTSKLVWISSPNWQVPANGVIPLAVVGGTCNYHKIALETLKRVELQSRRVVTCSSLEGVLEVVRAGLAVSLVPEGELRSGMVVVNDHRFPPLPHTGLKISFSEQEPSVAAKQLARVIENTLQNQVTLRRSA
ncbi:LysR family transcriptional regulator [Mesorhizobium sp.]|uniref:LysR family transcriptional regulator n=1 Tax=Mesorhizobium sp. TaxID=1871066 RepID=UPI0025C3D173|nr:LysR family transcriptional regulator [Mesorhizobium sp.]